MTKRLSIAYIIFRTRENTGSKVVFQHVNALRKRGHIVTVYTLFGKPAVWFPKEITTHSIFSFFLHKQPDIVVATFWPTAYVTMLLPVKKKFYCIMGWEEDFYDNPILRFFARRTHKLPLRKLVLSDYLSRRLAGYTKKKERVDKIITFIINDAFYKAHSDIYPKSKGKVTILSVISWYNRYKGPDLLVRVIAKLKKKHPEYHFILAGREAHSYSPLIDEFHSNLSTSELITLYRRADLMLITSRVEGFYIPGLEAMAARLPVITTNSGGVLEYAIPGKTAIVVDTLAKICEDDLIEKLQKNKQLRQRLIDGGAKMAKKYQGYTFSDMGYDLEKIFLKR